MYPPSNDLVNENNHVYVEISQILREMTSHQGHPTDFFLIVHKHQKSYFATKMMIYC